MSMMQTKCDIISNGDVESKGAGSRVTKCSDYKDQDAVKIFQHAVGEKYDEEKVGSEQIQLSNLLTELALLHKDHKEIEPNSLLNAYLKLRIRNIMLEESLDVKEEAMGKLLSVNSSLKEQMVRNNAIRLSQLEILALRNVELEKEISSCSPGSSRSSLSTSRASYSSSCSAVRLSTLARTPISSPIAFRRS